ncbi:MAG: hypothetical protein ACHP7F_04150 [Actinomycetales bacterium]
MAAWHPGVNAQPIEWRLRQDAVGEPYAVVRRFEFGDPKHPEIWFRVVTWTPRSEGRELIGWCRTIEAAAAAGWDYRCASESWINHRSEQRTDAAIPFPERPPAAELVRFYRAALRRRPAPSTHGPQRSVPARMPTALADR